MSDPIKAQEALADLDWIQREMTEMAEDDGTDSYSMKVEGALKRIRAALTAASQTQGGGIPMGAIENGRAFMERVEAFYSFRDEQNNPLRNCVEWQEFCICFMNLAEWAQHSTRPSTPEGMALVRVIEKYSPTQYRYNGVWFDHMPSDAEMIAVQEEK